MLRSKPEVEFQHGGRLFFKKGSSLYLSRELRYVDEICLLIDFDLLNAVTSMNTKPELVLSRRGRHLEKSI